MKGGCEHPCKTVHAYIFGYTDFYLVRGFFGGVKKGDVFHGQVYHVQHIVKIMEIFSVICSMLSLFATVLTLSQKDKLFKLE